MSESAVISMATLEDIHCRHRRERKELQAKIQMLKKNAPKSDKKKRKETMEEVARLESAMELRHTEELKAAELEEKKEEQPVEEQDDSVKNGTTEDIGDVPQARISKAQKRRDKKALEARKREENIRAAESEDTQNTPKAIEARDLQIKLKEHELNIYQVPSDGDCMYNAISHQVQEKGLGNVSAPELRNDTADYIRANKDTFICYMTHPDTLELLNDDEFEKYCESVRSTHAWGGQIELEALSTVLKTPIEVIQAAGPPTVHGARFSGPKLVITYHRHMYRLGEHYNSTVPMSKETVDTTNNDQQQD